MFPKLKHKMHQIFLLGSSGGSPTTANPPPPPPASNGYPTNKVGYYLRVFIFACLIFFKQALNPGISFNMDLRASGKSRGIVASANAVGAAS